VPAGIGAFTVQRKRGERLLLGIEVAGDGE
jgi:hypothetical protein